MMSHLKQKSLWAIVLALTLVSCGSDDDPVQAVRNEVQELRQGIELNGKWQAGCARSPVLGAPVREAWEFGNGTFTNIHILSSGRNCATTLAEIRSSGAYDVQAVEGLDQVTDLNLHYTQIQVTLFDESAVERLNDRNFCGKVDWKLDEVRIINSGQTPNCFVPQLPGDLFGAVAVDDGADQLYLSDTFAEKDNERSRTIDRDKIYTEYE